MNRGYTVEQYETFIQRAISYLPDVSIAGDIIVGFPSETEEDFEMTSQARIDEFRSRTTSSSGIPHDRAPRRSLGSRMMCPRTSRSDV